MKYGITILVGFLFLIRCTMNGDTKANKDAAVAAKAVVEKKKTMPDIVPDTFSLNYIMGKFDPSEHKDFVLVNAAYCSEKKEIWLRKETYTAFLQMAAAAKKDKVALQILSGTRNFEYQKRIWENKWTGKQRIEDGRNAAKVFPKDLAARALKILEFSSMPSTSRHHWGTDMDLNYLSNDYFKNGQGKKIYDWLNANAATYGFCQPYSDKADGRTGYNQEKWHWTFMPVSRVLTRLAKANLKNEMIVGFEGAETAPAINVVEKYVLGIKPACAIED